jgi:histidyl-tRNA synthetase
MGLERLVALLENGKANGLPSPPPLDAYLVAVGAAAQAAAPGLAERLRDAIPDLRLQCHCGGGSFKSQFKKADRSGARFALVLGEEELKRGTLGVKPLRGDGEQRDLSHEELGPFLLTARQDGP